MKKYGPSLKNVFAIGDFNITDEEPIFKELEGLKSLRRILPREDSDLEPTFNGFKNILASLGHIFMKSWVTLDHIFVKLDDLIPLKFSVLREEVVSDHDPIIG